MKFDQWDTCWVQKGCVATHVNTSIHSLKHESLVFPRTESERVSNLLGNDYVVTNAPTFNKSLLRLMNIIWQVSFKPIC
jgi:hypothetical protein